MGHIRHVDSLWSQLRRYVETVEAFIAQSDDRLPLTAEQRTVLLKEPERELEMPLGYEELIEATEIFPQVLRRSAFVLIMTLLETMLNELCEALQRWSENPVSVYDMQGRGIQRAVQYIRLVTKIAPTELQSWQKIQDLKHIRDLLVHANGRVRGMQLDQPPARIAKSHPLVDLVPAGDVSGTRSCDHVALVRSGLCERAIVETGEFLRSLLQSLDARGIRLDSPRSNSALEPTAPKKI
jgi:hypothetical protein